MITEATGSDRAWRRYLHEIPPGYEFATWESCGFQNDIEQWVRTVQNPDERRGLVLSGSPGSGKTMAVSLMALVISFLAKDDERRKKSKCHDLTFCYAPELIDYVRDPENSLSPLMQVKWLIWDDAGAGHETAWTVGDRLLRVFEERHRYRLPTIVTTNLSADDWQTRAFYPRLQWRIAGQAMDWIEVGGKSKR